MIYFLLVLSFASAFRFKYDSNSPDEPGMKISKKSKIKIKDYSNPFRSGGASDVQFLADLVEKPKQPLVYRKRSLNMF